MDVLEKPSILLSCRFFLKDDGWKNSVSFNNVLARLQINIQKVGRMKKILITIISGLVFATMANTVLARSIDATARAGQTTIVGGDWLVHPVTCAPMQARKPKLVKDPSNGKVSFGQYRLKISEGRCKGKSVLGNAVYYRGNGKKDTFKVLFTGSNNTDGMGNGAKWQTIKVNH